MRIGIFCRSRSAFSVKCYAENIIREMDKKGIDLVRFTEKEACPLHIDFYWDIGTGRPGPYKKLLNTPNPLIVTFHGIAHLALGVSECYGSRLKDMLFGFAQRIKTLYDWLPYRNRCAAIITVSSYAKWEVQKYLGQDGEKIFPIYHGVDLKIFKPSDEPDCKKSYFLHVSQYQPKKNVNRIIEAYTKIPEKNKPQLVMVVPGYPDEDTVPDGIQIIRTPLEQKNLATLYQGAIAFVFPSLHETFGMPILEAMACGCPVITSNVTACPEVAGDAALLVNPYSVGEIATAMKRLISDTELRKNLREKGLKRASMFTWHRSAEEHLRVFEAVLRG